MRKSKGIGPGILLVLAVAIAIPIATHYLITDSVTVKRISRDIEIIKGIDSLELLEKFTYTSINYSVMQGTSGVAELSGRKPVDTNDKLQLYWFDTNRSPDDNVEYPNQETIIANVDSNVEGILGEYLQQARSKKLRGLKIPQSGEFFYDIAKNNQSFNYTIVLDSTPKYQKDEVLTETWNVWSFNSSIRIFDQFNRGRTMVNQDVNASGGLKDDVQNCISGYPMQLPFSQSQCPANFQCPTQDQAAREAFRQNTGRTIERAESDIEDCAANAVSAAQASANFRDNSPVNQNYRWNLPLKQNDAKINYTCGPVQCNSIQCGGGTGEVRPQGKYSNDPFEPNSPVNVNAWDFTGWNRCDNLDHGWNGVNKFCQNMGFDGALTNDRNPCFYEYQEVRHNWDPYSGNPSLITGQPTPLSGRAVTNVKCYNIPENGYSATTTCYYGYQEVLQVDSSLLDVSKTYPTYSYTEGKTSMRNIALSFLIYIKATRF